MGKQKDIFPVPIRIFKYRKNGEDLSKPDGVIRLIKEAPSQYCIEEKKFMLGFPVYRKRYQLTNFDSARDFFEERLHSIKNRHSIETETDTILESTGVNSGRTGNPI